MGKLWLRVTVRALLGTLLLVAGESSQVTPLLDEMKRSNTFPSNLASRWSHDMKARRLASCLYKSQLLLPMVNLEHIVLPFNPPSRSPLTGKASKIFRKSPLPYLRTHFGLSSVSSINPSMPKSHHCAKSNKSEGNCRPRNGLCTRHQTKCRIHDRKHLKDEPCPDCKKTRDFKQRRDALTGQSASANPNLDGPSTGANNSRSQGNKKQSSGSSSKSKKSAKKRRKKR